MSTPLELNQVVIVINKNSSFYKEEGIVIEIDEDFAAVIRFEEEGKDVFFFKRELAVVYNG